MKLPRDLTGRALVKVLCRDWNYRVVHQEGSHIILQTDIPTHQRIPVPDHSPLRVGTLNGAYASYEENLKGSIEAGKLADLVVLGRDPLKENPSTLVTIPVERTMAGGRWTFES